MPIGALNDPSTAFAGATGMAAPTKHGPQERAVVLTRVIGAFDTAGGVAPFHPEPALI